MFMDLARRYDKHVLSNLQIDDTYREMVLKLDNTCLTEYLKEVVPDPFIRDFIHNFIEHI